MRDDGAMQADGAVLADNTRPLYPIDRGGLSRAMTKYDALAVGAARIDAAAGAAAISQQPGNRKKRIALQDISPACGRGE